MTVLEIIEKIQTDKQNYHIEPSHATLLEIEGLAVNANDSFSRQIVRAEIIQLWRDGIISMGETLNGSWIKIKGNG